MLSQVRDTGIGSSDASAGAGMSTASADWVVCRSLKEWNFGEFAIEDTPESTPESSGHDVRHRAHVPFLLDCREAGTGVLVGFVSRSQGLLSGLPCNARAVFSGLPAEILPRDPVRCGLQSPSSSMTMTMTMTVIAQGVAEIVAERQGARALVGRLVGCMGSLAVSERIAGCDRLCENLTVFEMRVRRISSNAFLSSARRDGPDPRDWSGRLAGWLAEHDLPAAA